MNWNEVRQNARIKFEHAEMLALLREIRELQSPMYRPRRDRLDAIISRIDGNSNLATAETTAEAVATVEPGRPAIADSLTAAQKDKTWSGPEFGPFPREVG